MLSFLLAWSSLSSVPFLSDKMLERTIAARQPHEVLAIIFADSLSADPTLQTAFRNASKPLEGLVKLAELDARRYQQVPPLYGVTQVPAIRIWTDSGVIPYNGANTSQAIAKKLTALIPDITQKADRGWATGLETSPVAIFFPKSERIPPLWKAMAIRYQNTSYRIGVADSAELIQFYEVGSLPAIYASNGESSEFFKGQVNASRLVEWLDSFRASSAVKKPDVSFNEIETPDKFETNCLGGKNLCIVVKASKISPSVGRIAREFGKLKIRWFAGMEGLPYDFMKTSAGAWVYNPKRDGFAHAGSDDELRTILEAVENGQAKFEIHIDDL